MSYYGRGREPTRTLTVSQIKQIEASLQELERKATQWEARAREWEAAAAECEAKAQELETLAAKPPLGLGRPRDIGLAVAFLCSEGARYITGATIDVNGGIYMR